MRVIGFDPGISVSRAWQLSSGVQQAGSLDALFIDADMVTLHVPLTEDTRAIVDERRFGLMRPGAVLLNFARDPLVDETALLASLESGRLFAYVTDFPTPGIKDHPAVTALPHLGASTGEAESNSVKVVAQTIRGYLEDGTIRHSVNYPEAVLHRGGGYRLAIVNANVPGIVGRVSTALAAEGLNIADLLNVSQGDLAYTLIDVETPIPEKTFAAIQGIDGVVAARRV
jgi:D-3-phosphoglycerate dehydrogenase